MKAGLSGAVAVNLPVNGEVDSKRMFLENGSWFRSGGDKVGNGNFLEKNKGRCHVGQRDRCSRCPVGPAASPGGAVAPYGRYGSRPAAIQGGRGPARPHRQREIGALLGGLLLLLPVEPVEGGNPEIPDDRRRGDRRGRTEGQGTGGEGGFHRGVRARGAPPAGARPGGKRRGADPERGGARDVREARHAARRQTRLYPLAGPAGGAPP